MKIAGGGMGYAGLYTAACPSVKFTGVKVDGGLVSRLERGEAPIHEKRLPALLKVGVARENLSFSSSYDSVRGTDVDIIAVGTAPQDGSIDGGELDVLGAAFKKGSDDVGGSRVIVLARILPSKGARVSITDPKAMEGARRELGARPGYFEDAQDCVKGTHAAVVITAWDAFKEPKASNFLKLMRNLFVFDAGRLYDPNDFRLPGLNFQAVGRGLAQ